MGKKEIYKKNSKEKKLEFKKKIQLTLRATTTVSRRLFLVNILQQQKEVNLTYSYILSFFVEKKIIFKFFIVKLFMQKRRIVCRFQFLQNCFFFHSKLFDISISSDNFFSKLLSVSLIISVERIKN